MKRHLVGYVRVAINRVECWRRGFHSWSSPRHGMCLRCFKWAK